jgi:hypothetical protein
MDRIMNQNSILFATGVVGLQAASRYASPFRSTAQMIRAFLLAAALPKLVDPDTARIVPVDGGADNGAASVHEQGSQLLVATLADAREHTPVSAGVLTRD